MCYAATVPAILMDVQYKIVYSLSTRYFYNIWKYTFFSTIGNYNEIRKKNRIKIQILYNQKRKAVTNLFCNIMIKFTEKIILNFLKSIKNIQTKT